jgi:glyoxylase-like metal-dependent hydrolase (beta-lactamase superfamily II)
MPVEEITSGLARLQLAIANVYFVGAPGGWVLVDTGTPHHTARIRGAAEEHFGPGARPGAILLTHGHWDHAGSALELAAMWDVPVYAHALERPYLTGQAAYPPKDPTVGGALALLCRFFPTSLIDLGGRLRDLPPDGEVPGLPGWRWYHTPGHAPGHAAFFDPGAAVLLSGDACVTMELDSPIGMLTQEPRISGPPTPFTYDWEQARHSLELLAGLRPLVIASGHGDPIRGSAAAREIAQLARDFTPPGHGRYVSQPARTDANGVAFLPPAPPDPLPKIAAAAGLAALAIAIMAAAVRRDNSGK